jgi:regulator of vacuolar morphogenesis
MGDASGSRTAGVEAKRLLRDLGDRVEALENGLKGLEGLGEGERRRREEMVEGIKAERGDLMRLAEAGVRTSAFHPASHTQTPSSTSTSSTSNNMPGHFAPSGRVFGKQQPPQETSETRPLDDRGLLQLQQTKMDGQDDQLKELSKLLGRQKVMGEEIHREIGEQNDLLDDIEGEVGKVGGKMARAKRDLNKLS